MKTRRNLVMLAVGALSTFTMPVTMLNSGAAVAGDRQPRDRGCVIESGSYIVVLESGSVFDSRVVLSFQKGGTLAVISSNQRGGTNFAPFSSKLGTWECVGNQITARGIDFTLSPIGQEQQIGRVDYKATVTPTGRIQGNVEVRFFPLTTPNPQASNPPAAFTNTFRGRLIKAQ